MEMNGLRTAKKLKVGLELVIPKPIGGGRLAHAGERTAPVAVVASARPGETEPRRAEQARREPTSKAHAAAERADRARSTLRVRPGETLWSIARRLGVELEQLCRWNGIENPKRHKLLAGAQLVVYGQRG